MNFFSRLYRRLRWEWRKRYDWVYRRLSRAPYVMSYKETVDYILENKASISRFGDGELGVIKGHSLGFQTRDNDLGKRLAQVLSSNESKLLVCLPDGFERLDRYVKVEQDFWASHNYFNRRDWYKRIDKKKKYGNTFLSRFYSMEFNQELALQRLPLLKSLWNNRNVIMIEGADTKLGVGNDLFDNAKSIRRIIAPSRDAFSRYDEILNKALSISDEDALFILALGPTATVLAADLCKNRRQALDLGHIDIEYEWFKRGVKEKVPITGKFSNEALILGNAKNAITGQLVDSQYESQIIDSIL